jgi:hypothetical protein
MALTTDERTTLAAWLDELTTELAQLSRRLQSVAVVIREEPPPPESQPPTPDG